MENSRSLSSWQSMINQSFLSLYEVKDEDAATINYLQGYDFIFDCSEALFYVLVNETTIEINQHEIDNSKLKTWRKEVTNQLMKRHAQIYLHNDKLIDKEASLAANKEVYFIGLSSLGVRHLEDQADAPVHKVQYEYGSQFFAEDCVLDLDDEKSILQIFSDHNFSKLVSQLKTPTDLTAFLQFHRSHLAELEPFSNESALLQHFLQTANFYQKALNVQQQLVSMELLDQIEPRLLQLTQAPPTSIGELSADILKKSEMWYQLFNNVVQRYYAAGTPIPKSEVELLVDESLYTYASLVDRILYYKYKDKESRWNGYIDHQPSYNRADCHYMMVFYAQYEHSPLSADKVRANHQQLLSELNTHSQQPVIKDLFLIGVEVSDSQTSVNTEVTLDIFYQQGSSVNLEMQRLYQQLAELKSKS